MRADVKTVLGAAVLAVVVLAAPPARAQADETAKSVTLFTSYVDSGDRLGVEADPGYGVAFSGPITPYIGLEGSVMRAPELEYELVSESTDYTELRLGALFYFSRPHDKLLPYLALGGAFMTFSREAALEDGVLEQLALDAGRTELEYSSKATRYDEGFGLNWGLGMHVFLAKRLALRIDARWTTALGAVDFNSFEPMIGLSFWTGPDE